MADLSRVERLRIAQAFELQEAELEERLAQLKERRPKLSAKQLNLVLVLQHLGGDVLPESLAQLAEPMTDADADALADTRAKLRETRIVTRLDREGWAVTPDGDLVANGKSLLLVTDLEDVL